VPGLDGPVHALTTWDPDGAGPEREVLVVGGWFTAAGDMTAHGIVLWDGTSWHPLGSGMDSAVRALTVCRGELIAGGYFSTAGEVTAEHVARWDGTAWHPLGSGVNGGVETLTVYHGDLIAGGWFTSAGDVSTSRIAAWDGASWRPLGSEVRFGAVYASSSYDGELVIGGPFWTIGSVAVDHIARWNGTSWRSLAGGTGGYVYAMTVYENDLIAGGWFRMAGGVPAAYIARWDGTRWHPLGSGTGFSVYALTVYHGDLIAGGEFRTAGDVSASCVARWDGTDWWPLGSGVDGGGDYGPAVYALTSYDEGLIVAGDFTTAGDRVASYWARWGVVQGDTDGDGVSDDCDACPDSDRAATIVIDGCDTRVPNRMLGDEGCTMADRVAECAEGARNHGAFVNRVAHLVNAWRHRGLINIRQAAAIQRCAARADIPRRNEHDEKHGREGHGERD